MFGRQRRSCYKHRSLKSIPRRLCRQPAAQRMAANVTKSDTSLAAVKAPASNELAIAAGLSSRITGTCCKQHLNWAHVFHWRRYPSYSKHNRTAPQLAGSFFFSSCALCCCFY